MITLDFETKSKAGYAPKEGGGWQRLAGAQKYGIEAVGAAVYAQHPSTEVISLSFAFDEEEPELWVPGMPAPQRLFTGFETEEEIEAWNASFEVWIWRYVAVPKLHWPHVPLHKIRDAMARARAYSLPGKLSEAGKILRLPQHLQKDPEGDALIKFFCGPRQPTKGNKSEWNYPSQNIEKANRFYGYNRQDVRAERATVACTPQLSSSELAWWQVEQACNRRGVHVDMPLVHGAIAILDELYRESEFELRDLTQGAVQGATQLTAMQNWMHSYDVHTDSMDEDAIATLLRRDLPSEVRRVLEIRQSVGGAAVKKYYSVRRLVAAGDRLHDLFNYHGAHTGRETAADTQPQNFPNSGPEVRRCAQCGHHHGASKPVCPWCGVRADTTSVCCEWNPQAASEAILCIVESSRTLLERYFDNVADVLSACLRGVFKATPGYVMLGADFSSIEGVGAAELTQEKWRQEVFRTHGKIYEMAGAKMLGCTLDDVLRYKQENGSHHPIRKRAKVGELAGGYGGSVGAWVAFGALDYFPDEDAIKQAVYAWRTDSPQFPMTWYAMHDVFVAALLNPGQPQYPAKKDRSGAIQGYVPDVVLTYHSAQDVLRMGLPSGRRMTYHRPRLEQEEYGRPGLSFEGWNTNPKMGPYGWIRKRTFGGRLFENLVQASCRDLLTHAAVNAYHAGFEICLHVHDELCVEVPESQASVLNTEMLATIMMDTPAWAKAWPVRVPLKDCWTGQRYQK